MNQRTIEPRTHGRLATMVAVIHIAVVAGLSAWAARDAAGIASGFAAGQAANAHVSIGWVVFWVACIVATAAAPWQPVVALVSYVAAAYATPRYGGPYAVLMASGVLNVLAITTLTGVMAYRVGRAHDAHDTHGRATGRWYLTVMVGFSVWVALTAGAAALRGEAWSPHPNHHPLLFFQAFALFLGMAMIPASRRTYIALAGGLCAALIVRGWISGTPRLAGDGDIAFLVVMAIPMAVMGVRASGYRGGRGSRVGQVFFLLAIAGLVGVLALTRNRGGAVAFVVMLPVLWWHARRRWRVLVVVLPVLAVLAVAFVNSDYWGRFTGIWQGTDDANSVEQRLTVWRASRRMIAEHALMGVGPGRFHHALVMYEPGVSEKFAAHNNFVHVAGEMGIIGVALYVAVFGGALVLCVRSWRRVGHEGPDWPGPAARMIFTSLVVYLAAGLFMSRHDLPLAYLICGGALGVFRASRGQVNLD